MEARRPTLQMLVCPPFQDSSFDIPESSPLIASMGIQLTVKLQLQRSSFTPKYLLVPRPMLKTTSG
jgi:hypothetical protein